MIEENLPENLEILARTIESKNVPDEFPSISAIDTLLSGEDMLSSMNRRFHSMMLKERLIQQGMYGYISKAGAKWLADQFPGEKWIDPIAGSGWFAKALREQGVDIIAGDIGPEVEPVTEVIKDDGANLISNHGEDRTIMLISWAHHHDKIDFECAKIWGSDRPILVYGEFGGCCNSSEFTERFQTERHLNDFPDMVAKSLRNQSFKLGYFI